MLFDVATYPFLETFFGPCPLHVSEIGDGNLNFVYRIQDNAGKSLILKYAPPYLRLLGNAFPLEQKRICVEMHTMDYFKSIAPAYIPTLYRSDEEAFVMAMEELKGYETLQKKQLETTIPLAIYAQLGDFLAKVYNNAPPYKREGYYENATLQNISHHYIFVYPYIPNHEALAIPSFFKPQLKDTAFKKGIKTLEHCFLNSKQTLIHGDLHTGSVMIKDENIAIIDAEFSFFGHIGFDIGTLFAHIIFGEIYSLFMAKKMHYKEAIGTLWERFGHNEAILQTSVGFCGSELFRRLVVPAKAKPLEAIPAQSDKEKAYHLADALAIDLVLNCLYVKHIEDFYRLVDKHLCPK